jgi:hypothetical protein
MASLRTKAMAGGVAAVLAMGGGFYALGWNQVHVVNGLSAPVVVQVDGTPHRVLPDARVEVGRFRAGTHELVALREDGRELERVTATVAAFGTNVYSVLGAAPLERSVVYYSGSGATAREPQVVSSCGGPSFQVYDVDHPFEEPPSSVEVSQGTSGSVSRSVLRLDHGGLGACLNSTRVEPLKLAELAARVLAVSASPEERRGLLRYAGDAFSRGGQPERAMALAQPLLDDPKATREDHRVVQDLAQLAGRDVQVTEKYRARYEADRSAENAYLLARLVDLPEALSLADGALAASPDDGWLHRIRLWALSGLARWPEALVEADWFLDHPDEKEARPWALQVKVRALVAQGRAADALAVLKKELDGEAHWGLDDAVLVERVAARAGTPPWTDPFTRVARPEDSATERELFKYFYELSIGRKGLVRPPKAGLVAFDILEAARNEPATALQRIQGLAADQELYLTSEQAWVLLAEAWRVKNDAAAARLVRFAPGSGDGTALKRFLLEGEERGLRDAQPDSRCAVLLARARTLEASGDAAGAKAMVARLEAADPLRGLAVLAVEGWSQHGQPAAEAVRQIKQSGALPAEMQGRPRGK